ncbi:MAG: hypothetical protein OEV21_02640 [Thermoplasmata archaeon]|nr:hypothetical protein [Thermoplasmata archaeon]
MSTPEAIVQKPAADFPNVVFARRLKMTPELLSRYEDMKIFLDLRENRQKIENVNSSFNEEADYSCIEQSEIDDIINDIEYMIKTLAEI